MADRGRPRKFDRTAALQRAMEVFWAKGFAGASMADLTAAMGINSPSLYAAFGSKEQLFREAVDLYRGTEGQRVWKDVETLPTARATVEAILMRTAESFTRPGKPTGCLVVLGAVVGGDAGEAVGRDLCERRRGNHDALTRRLERAVAEGELPQGIDCGAIATFYLTVQQGMSLQARDGATRETLTEVARSAMAAWPALTASPRIAARQ